ncbi:hypothetical protein NDU88_000392 [Pleurodeles waltl]|uniref:Uncharacterized protein n=1 Tax=Pleurodeles waltl TaxID=8319 RepID=A0AAV7U3D2_PLEWA|nr:hypothetical protein NDU88_000392 [Pleurodeles waltl]
MGSSSLIHGAPSQRPALSQRCCSLLACLFKAKSGRDHPNPRGSPCPAKESGQDRLGRQGRRALAAPPATSSSPIVTPIGSRVTDQSSPDPLPQ